MTRLDDPNLLQYVGLFGVWAAVLVAAAWCLAKGGVRQWRVLGAFWAAIYYLTIQIHWVLHIAPKMPQPVEWWWSLWETLVGVVVYFSLPARSPIPKRRSTYHHEQKQDA